MNTTLLNLYFIALEVWKNWRDDQETPFTVVYYDGRSFTYHKKTAVMIHGCGVHSFWNDFVLDVEGIKNKRELKTACLVAFEAFKDKQQDF